MKPFPLSSLRRFEHIANIDYSANSVQNLPTQGGQLQDPRWLWGLHLTFQGRATMPASGGPTGGTEADQYYGIAQILERITVEGFHRSRQRNEKFYDLRGADALFLSDLFTLRAMPKEPTTWSYTGSATNDFRIHILVPFVPLGTLPSEQTNYLLDGPNYDTLKLTVQFGDAVSAFNSGTAPTLTAYGSSSGNPQLKVAGYFVLAGPSRFAGRVPGRIFRYGQEVTGSIMTTTATRTRLIDIPRGNFIRSILMKTGVKKTGVTAGNNAYASLSDTILTEINVYRGLNRPVRYYPIQQQIRAENVLNRGYAGAAGLNYIDFAPHGVLGEAFDARALVSGSSGQTDFYIAADVTGASSQAALFVWEEIQAIPLVSASRR